MRQYELFFCNKPSFKFPLLKLALAMTFLGSATTLNAHAAPEDQTNGTINEVQAQANIASVKPAVALIEVETETGQRWGSGFFVSSDGLMVTNNHVIKNAQKITCLFKNKDKFPAKLIKVDPQYDLALIKVDAPKPFPTVKLGDSETLPEGLLVGVTGYPSPGTLVWMGMALDSSTSRGSLSGLRYGSGTNTYLGDRSLQIDAPVTDGISGGPVFRLDTGEAVGVLTLSVQNSVSLAVPVNQIKLMIAAQAIKVAPRAVTADSVDAIVESGDLRLLNTVGINKELPTLFGKQFDFSNQIDDRAVDAISDWQRCTGERPYKVTELVSEGDDIFFAATDGRLRRWDTSRMYDDFQVLLDDEDAISVFPPVANSQIIVSASGSLALNTTVKEENAMVQMFTFGLFGGGGTDVSIDGYSSLYGLNRRNGNIDWNYDGGFMGTPVLYNNRVYFGGIGVRGCLDALQGREIWKLTNKQGGRKSEWFHIGYAGPLGLYGIAVPVQGKSVKDGPLRLVGAGDVRVERYDPTSNKLLWKKQVEIGNIEDRDRPLSTAMFMDEKKHVIYALAGNIVAAVNADTGAVLWSYDRAKEIEKEMKAKKIKDRRTKPFNFTANMTINDGIIYLGSEDHKLYAFNGANGSILWTYNTRGVVGQPAYADGQILAGSSDGYLYSVDARTGNLLWRVANKKREVIRTRPLVRNGMVFAVTDKGSIMTVRVPVN